MRSRLALPLLALALVQLQLVLAALLCARDPLDPTTFSRRDSTKYLKIARLGYFEEPGDPKAGDAGWFPGYPLMIRAGAALGARPVAVGRALAVLFHLGLLAVVWNLLLPLDATRRLLALLVAAFFPGAVYCEAVFPVSMFLFFGLLAMAFCARDRFLAAGVCAAVAAFTYSTGFLIAAALAIGVPLRRERPLAWIQAPLLGLLGLLAVLVYHHFALGRWDAFFAFQREFGHTLSNPLATLATHVGRLADPHLPSRLIGVQTLLVAGLLAVAIAVWWRERAAMGRLEAMLVGSAALFWIVPLLLGPTVSPYRAEALLVGITPLLGRLRTTALVCLLVVLVALGVGMSALFFDDVLV